MSGRAESAINEQPDEAVTRTPRTRLYAAGPGRMKVWITPRKGQTEVQVEQDLKRSADLGHRMLERGVESYRSYYRWIGPVKMMAAKEVGPPPWRFPKVLVQGRRRHVRFGLGWRSTAYWLNLHWAGLSNGHAETPPKSGENGSEVAP